MSVVLSHSVCHSLLKTALENEYTNYRLGTYYGRVFSKYLPWINLFNPESNPRK